MAAAEARTAWQRAANRFLVQEDAKRAPKLACCPSSSAQQYDSNNVNTTNGQEQYISHFMPLNWSCMNSNMPPDTKWWLQLQPNFGCHRDLMSEQLNGLTNELEEAEQIIHRDSSFSEETMHDGENKEDCPMESSWVVPATSRKHHSETRIQEMNAVTRSILQQEVTRKVDMETSYFQEELFDMQPVDQLSSKITEKTNLDLETPWEGTNKCEPWWRFSDNEELTYLVEQKSLQNVVNCDLPRPAHMSTNPFSCLESLEGNRILTSSLGCKLDADVCHPIDCPQHSFTFGDMDRKYWYWDHASRLPCETKKYKSEAWSSNTTTTDPSESQKISKSDPNRDQLLEALCHSQTRARIAEMAVKKAYDEKEHVMKLLFRQASHLFAYKQWLWMLQLESLCLQLRIKDHPISTIFPIPPLMPLMGKPMAKDRGEAKRKGKKQKKCNLCKYAFLFVVGLGLAGVGSFLGCCLGWLSPTL